MMPILVARSSVKCSKNGEEVRVDERCINCDSFEFLSLRGSHLLVSCSIENKPEPKKEEKGIGGLKRWSY